MANNFQPVFLQRQSNNLGRKICPCSDEAIRSFRAIVTIVGYEHVLTSQHALESGGHSSTHGSIHVDSVGHVHHCARFGAQDLIGFETDGDYLTFLAFHRGRGAEVDWEVDDSVGACEGIFSGFN